MKKIGALLGSILIVCLGSLGLRRRQQQVEFAKPGGTKTLSSITVSSQTASQLRRVQRCSSRPKGTSAMERQQTSLPK